MIRLLFAALLCCGWVARAEAPHAPADLYRIDKVWEAHFIFTPEQWDALEPKQTEPGRMPFGGGGPMLQGKEGSRNGLSAARGIEFEFAKATLEFAGEKFPDVAVRYKGNGTFMNAQQTSKRSFKVDLNKHAKGRTLGGAGKLNFHNCITDASYMNEVLAYQLYRDAGVPAPRTSYARVYVTIPGRQDHQYLGLYSIVENEDAHFAEEVIRAKKGALFKPVTPNLFADLGSEWAKYRQTYDPKTDLTPAQQQRVIDFCRLVSTANDAEFESRLGDFLDLEEFARFMAVTVYLSTLDSILGMGQNFVVHLHPKSNRLQFVPWDLDHAFGQFFLSGTQEQRENLSIQNPWQGENRFLERVFKVATFQKLYRANLKEFAGGLFKPERLHKQVDALAVALRPAVKDESAEKLARFEKVVAGESVGPEGFGGGGGGRGGFGGGTKPIKPFAIARIKSVDDQLAGRSEGMKVERFGRNFGPGNFVGPAMLEKGDTDKDGKLTEAEFNALGEAMYSSWDTNRTGHVSEEKLRAGITALLPTPPGMGGPGVGRPGGGPGAGGPPPGAGGPGGPRGFGGPGFGPGNFLAPGFMSALDENKDNDLTRDEVKRAFAKWFKDWDTGATGSLNEEKLQAGLNKVLGFRGGPGGGPRPGN